MSDAPLTPDISTPGEKPVLVKSDLPAPVNPPMHPAHSLASQPVPSPLPVPAPKTQSIKPPNSSNPMARVLAGDPDSEGPRMGFMDHLLELRKRLWICIITIVVCMALSLVFYKQIFNIMRMPLDKVNEIYRHDDDAHRALSLSLGTDVAAITNADPLGTMLMVVWLGVGAGLLLSSPIVFYQLWGFVAPGLKDSEKRAIKPVLYGGIGFFSAGAFIGYYFLFQVSIEFFVWLDLDLHIRPLYTIEYYMSLLMNVMAVSGLSCELPLIVGALAKMRVIQPSQLTQYWRFCILMAFILGAVLSPGTDVMSMLVFSLLFLGLYVMSVLMAFFFYPKENT